MVDVDGNSLPMDSQAKSVGLVWGLAVMWRLSLHSSYELGELSQCLRHDNSTINIVNSISISIIILPI